MDLNFVKFKHGLKQKNKVDGLILKIVEKIKGDVTLTNDLKNNMELLKLICTLIENTVNNKKNKDKINKLSICHEIYQKLFSGSLTKAELDVIASNVEFLLDTKQIKVYNIFKRTFKRFISFLEEKGIF
jgi:hypothetical protein